MVVRHVGWIGIDFIHMAQDREAVSTCKHGSVSRHRAGTATTSAALAYTWCVQVLRSPKEAFAAAMQSRGERCAKCVCLQGDYVEK